MHGRYNRQPVEVTTYNNGGTGFLGFLVLLFIALKLMVLSEEQARCCMSPVSSRSQSGS